MKKFSALLIILTGFSAVAQNEDDALRLSMTYFGGTARNMSMAGSFSALGGDYSVVLQNPAGVARFKKDNFSYTQTFENPVSQTEFYGSNTKKSGFSSAINNFSYVNVYNLDPREFNNWYGVQLGVGYNRLMSFEDRISYSGTADSSIIHSFINEANGTHPDDIYNFHPFTAGLAYDVFAIDPATGNQYTTAFNAGTANHERTITRSGGMGEINLSLSGNYANKLFIGGTFNFTKVNFNENYVHNETFNDTSLWLQGIRYTSNLSIQGWGYGARIGAIYLPTDYIRIGAAIQTPTLFLMSDSWDSNMSSDTKEGAKTVLPEYVPFGKYDYRIRNPFKANASVGFVLKQLGSISAEVEYVDYAMSKLSSKQFSESPYGFVSENAQIKNIYKSVFNYKVGAEARITSQFYLRGGYAFYPSPYTEESGNSQMPVQFYTGGLGINWGKFYVDFAYVLKKEFRNYYAYDPTLNGSSSSIDFNNSQYVFTLGLRID